MVNRHERAFLRPLASWSAWATTSFPVPVSPEMNKPGLRPPIRLTCSGV